MRSRVNVKNEFLLKLSLILHQLPTDEIKNSKFDGHFL